MGLDPSDAQVAMEYAVLCDETKGQAEARRIFDRIRQTGNALTQRAFDNNSLAAVTGADVLEAERHD
jgi:hypothetical protein